MKKILNSNESFVDESLEGILAAHGDMLKACGSDIRAVFRADAPVKNKVAIVTGGGYGHLPVFLGYVGKGLADGVAVGNVFTSPSCDTIINVTREVDGGKGVLYLFGNYVGDGMNFDMAGEIVGLDGIETRIVKVSDDIASAPRDSWQQRRGVAGLFFVYKTAGAKAEQLADLAEVQRIAEKTAERTATMGIAMSSCWVPGAGRPIFEISEEDIEVGMGIHGEPGVERIKLETSKEIAQRIVPKLVEDLGLNDKSGFRCLSTVWAPRPVKSSIFCTRMSINCLKASESRR
jgi:dihydroxyacetone kinase